MTDNKILAPWSDAQASALNRTQVHGKPSLLMEGWGYFHSFTCPRQHSAQATLVALPEGWACPLGGCDYTQDWAWEFMALPLGEHSSNPREDG